MNTATTSPSPAARWCGTMLTDERDDLDAGDDVAMEWMGHPVAPDAGVRRFAANVATVQRTEINEINTRRVALGLAPIPRSEIAGLEHVHSG